MRATKLDGWGGLRVALLGLALAGATGARADVTLHFNGGFVTSVGTGPGGSDISQAEGTATTIGFNANVAPPQGPIRLIDDFTIAGAPGQGVRLSSLTFHGVQSNSVTTNVQFEAFYVALYDGNPSLGGNLIAGDFTTNRLISSTWTGAYRLSSSGTPSTSRPITRLEVDMSWAPRLVNGTYWMQVSAKGDPALSTNPNPQTIFVAPHPVGFDNARQYFNGTWFDIWDLPFTVVGFCPADFNASHVVNVGDIFAYLTAWFAGNPDADFDGAGGPTVSDIFAYLTRWFDGC